MSCSDAGYGASGALRNSIESTTMPLAHEIQRGLLAVGAVLVVPGAAVDLQHRRERAGAGRLIEPRHPHLVAVALVDDVSDLELVALGALA